MDAGLLRDLDYAVAEAGFFGVRIAPDASATLALLTVLALPPDGPMDPDGRRVLHFGGVTTLEFSRRVDEGDWLGVPPRLPLASAAELEALLDDARAVEVHGGLSHFEIPDPVPRLVAEPGLRLGAGPVREGHSWRWGADVVESDGRRTVVDVGIWFTELAVQRADGTPIPVERFAADGVRWWTALRAGDPRVSGGAQQAAGLPGVIVPG